MSFLFLSYFLAFVLVLRGRKMAAFAWFALSTAMSIGMFLYHTTSSLNLNF